MLVRVIISQRVNNSRGLAVEGQRNRTLHVWLYSSRGCGSACLLKHHGRGPAQHSSTQRNVSNSKAAMLSSGPAFPPCDTPVKCQDAWILYEGLKSWIKMLTDIHIECIKNENKNIVILQIYQQCLSLYPSPFWDLGEGTNGRRTGWLQNPTGNHKTYHVKSVKM